MVPTEPTDERRREQSPSRWHSLAGNTPLTHITRVDADWVLIAAKVIKHQVGSDRACRMAPAGTERWHLEATLSPDGTFCPDPFPRSQPGRASPRDGRVISIQAQPFHLAITGEICGLCPDPPCCPTRPETNALLSRVPEARKSARRQGSKHPSSALPSRNHWRDLQAVPRSAVLPETNTPLSRALEGQCGVTGVPTQ